MVKVALKCFDGNIRTALRFLHLSTIQYTNVNALYIEVLCE